MHRRVPLDIPAWKTFGFGLRNQASCAEEVPSERHIFDIDELAASPWVGLHYKHEFLLHHRHELLEQIVDDSCRRSP
jgi:hypothetical protein